MQNKIILVDLWDTGKGFYKEITDFFWSGKISNFNSP